MTIVQWISVIALFLLILIVAWGVRDAYRMSTGKRLVGFLGEEVEEMAEVEEVVATMPLVKEELPVAYDEPQEVAPTRGMVMQKSSILDKPVDDLQFVTPKIANSLAAHHIVTVGDLYVHFKSGNGNLGIRELTPARISAIMSEINAS